MAGEGCSLQLHLALAAVWAISQHSEASHLSTVTHHIAVAVAPAVARPLWWRRSRHRRCRRQGSLVQTLDQCTHRDAARLLFQVSFRQCLHELNVCLSVCQLNAYSRRNHLLVAFCGGER